MELRQENLQLRWWWRLAATDKNRLLYKVWMKRCEQVRKIRDMKNMGEEEGRMSACVKMKEVLTRNGFEREWNDPTSTTETLQGEWITKIEEEMKKREEIARKKGIERCVERGCMSREHAEKVITQVLTFQPYLDCANNEGTWLKTRLRSNQLYLFDILGKQQQPQWSHSLRTCWICHKEEEDVRHFVVGCTEYEEERKKYVEIVKEGLKNEGKEEGQKIIQNTQWEDKDSLIAMILSTNENSIKNKDIAAMINRASMSYLSKIWKKRNEKLGGTITIIHGQIQIENK
jgi:hypothetical protein